MVFLGFLRRLNEIDATFKHAYLESEEFGTADMDADEYRNAFISSLNQAGKLITDRLKTIWQER